MYEHVLNHCKPWDFGVLPVPHFRQSLMELELRSISQHSGTFTAPDICFWQPACIWMAAVNLWSTEQRAKKNTRVDVVENFYYLLLVVVLCCNNFIYLEQFEQVWMLLHCHRSVRLFLLVVLEIGTDWIKFCLIAKFSEMQTKTFEAGGQI